MATLFLGQRVRVVRIDPSLPPDLLNRDGRITEIDDDFPDGRPLFGLDIFPLTSQMVGIDRVEVTGLEGWQLEPIQPSGHRAGDYSLSELLDRCRAGEGVPA